MTNAPLHLSVISQGRYDETAHGKYDKNYYYPTSAGKNIDIYMFDTSFNFSYDDFSDVYAQCDMSIEQGKVTKLSSVKVCYGYQINDHGAMTSAAAVGKLNGVAKNANIHGILLKENEQDPASLENIIDDIIAGLQYAKENQLFKPNKTILNFSIGLPVLISELENNEKYKLLQQLFNDMNDMGIVIVAGAGNDGVNTYDTNNNMAIIPCALDNVICTGGAANFFIPQIAIDEIDSSFYKLGNLPAYGNIPPFISNTGERVDIYGPMIFHYRGSITVPNEILQGVDLSMLMVEEATEQYTRLKHEEFMRGTSYTSPIVAGVAATIMSEHPDMEFNSQTMLEYLTNIGEKDILLDIPEGCPNVFINNGNTEDNPYISEISYKNSIRKIRINTMKSNLIALIILFVLEIAFVIIGIFLFENKSLKIMFCTIQLPFIIIFAFAPCNSICIYDYISKTFSSYITPIIPIPYTCLSTKINFNEISGFYLQKFKRGTKKYYKLGVKSINETEQIIAIGQDTSCKLEFDNSLDYMPYILRALLI